MALQELAQLQRQRRAAAKERRALEAERAGLLGTERKIRAALEKQLADIDGRVAAQRAAVRAAQGTGGVEAAGRALHSYEAHREELAERLAQPHALPATALLRLQVRCPTLPPALFSPYLVLYLAPI